MTAEANGIKFSMPGKDSQTSVSGINSSGDAVGSYSLVTSRGMQSYGFIRFADGSVTQIDIPKSHHNTFAAAIDDQDDVTGFYESGQNVDSGFLRTPDGTITSFSAPGASQTLPQAINAGTGQIVGWYNSDAVHGFMRTKGGKLVTIDYPGAARTFAYSLNSAGQIAGEYDDASFNRHGFVRQTDGSFTVIDPPNSIYTDDVAVNDKADVIGLYQDGSDNTYYGFLLHGGHFYVTSPNLSALNNSRKIVGNGSGAFLAKFRKGAFKVIPIDPPKNCETLFLSAINDSSLLAGYVLCNSRSFGYLLQK